MKKRKLRLKSKELNRYFFKTRNCKLKGYYLKSIDR